MEEQIFTDLKQVVGQLAEALKLPKTEISRDSAILRFQLCFDLAWKAIKTYAKQQGSECFSPKACFKTAFQLQLIEYNELWLKMIDVRNELVHVYNQEYAEHIYAQLTDFLNLFNQLSQELNTKIKS